MAVAKEYPRLKKLMMGYINMDAPYITGHTDFEGMIEFYTTRVSTRALRELMVEVENYRSDHTKNLDIAFLSEYDYGYHIEDVDSFLNVVTDVVSSVIAKAEQQKANLSEQP